MGERGERLMGARVFRWVFGGFGGWFGGKLMKIVNWKMLIHRPEKFYIV